MRILSGDIKGFSDRVRVVPLRKIDEPRGSLVAFDYAALPFRPERSFVIDGVPKGTKRGGHAHKSCEQLLVCLKGQLLVHLVYRNQCAEIVLDEPSAALYLAAGIWSEQTYEKTGTCLLAFASAPFDPDSYLSEPAE